ncbi:MAG: hypothetical protein QY318_01825 [Candidatus Dojkabacteria bacterium]|nr:MAG: hypothetical protein QY318_01825 [Candidatus Dojkabacteria bacterium]
MNPNQTAGTTEPTNSTTQQPTVVAEQQPQLTLDQQIDLALTGFESYPESKRAMTILYESVMHDGSDIAKRALLLSIDMISQQAPLNEFQLPGAFAKARRAELPLIWTEYLPRITAALQDYQPNVYSGINISEALFVVAGMLIKRRESRNRGEEFFREAAVAAIASTIPLDFKEKGVTSFIGEKGVYLEAKTVHDLIKADQKGGYQDMPTDDPRVRDVILEATRLYDTIAGTL